MDIMDEQKHGSFKAVHTKSGTLSGNQSVFMERTMWTALCLLIQGRAKHCWNGSIYSFERNRKTFDVCIQSHQNIVMYTSKVLRRFYIRPMQNIVEIVQYTALTEIAKHLYIANNVVKTMLCIRTMFCTAFMFLSSLYTIVAFQLKCLHLVWI